MARGMTHSTSIWFTTRYLFTMPQEGDQLTINGGFLGELSCHRNDFVQ